jgi:uncharacterized membrane protein YdbT with pleckstrin-like domain
MRFFHPSKLYVYAKGRSRMVNVERELREGENILARAKIHAAAVIVPAVVLVIGVALVLYARPQSVADWVSMLGYLIILIGVWKLVSSIAMWRTTQLVLTDERLFCETGLFPHKAMAPALNHVDRVEVRRGLLGRLMGYGTLVVSARGEGNLRVRYPQVVNAEELAQTIRDQMSVPTKRV